MQAGSEFYNPAIGKDRQCFVDGVLLAHCVEADEEGGWALQMERTAHDKPVFRNGGRQCRKVFGTVELRPRHPLEPLASQAIATLTTLIRDIRSGTLIVTSFDNDPESVVVNEIGSEWEIRAYSGRRTITCKVSST